MERFRVKVRRKKAISSYQALLVETIKDPKASWTESKPKLEKDPQGRATNPDLSEADMEKLFRDHVRDLFENKVTQEIPLDPLINKTGDVWHIFLEGEIKDMLYGYKFDGKFCPEEGHYFDNSRIVLDPYAKAVISRGEYGVLGPDGNCWPQMAGMIPLSDDKDEAEESEANDLGTSGGNETNTQDED